MTAEERPSKRDAFWAFFQEGWVSLHLDARRPGVDVPKPFNGTPHLVLQYGKNMPIAIPDLEVTDNGVSATLSFARTPHRTHVPWSAVYVIACTDGRGVLYHEDVPEEVTLVAPAVSGTNGKIVGCGDQDDDVMTQEAPTIARAQHLKSIPPDAGTPGDIDDEASVTVKRKRRPSLRLVK